MIKKLEEAIKHHRNLYYNDVPEISDAAFDALVIELRKLDPTNKVLEDVGASPPSTLPSAEHKMPMGSLNNIFDQSELRDWLDKHPASSYVLQPKLDGCSVQAEYEDGKFRRGLTRGDGKTGSVITFNMSQMKNVPREIPGFTGAIRGEAVLLHEDFESLNKSLKEEGKEYKNPRNAVSGVSKRKDGKYSEFITVMWFDQYQEGVSLSEYDKYLSLSERGLRAVKTLKIDVDVERVIQEFWKRLSENRGVIGCDLDGLVIKVNESKERDGYDDDLMYPDSQIAYKLPAEAKITTVKSIKWEVGRTGRINPIAVVEPIHLDGATVSRVTLHSFRRIEELNVAIGSEVVVSRRGGVIPHVEESLTDGTGIGLVLEEDSFLCPMCGSSLDEDGAYLVCKNSDCGGKQDKIFKTFVEAFEWDGIAGKTIERLLDSSALKTPADYFRLTLSNFEEINMAGMGEKILKQIQSKREVSLAKFIRAFNITGMAEGRVEKLVEAGYDTIDSLFDVSISELTKVEGIGEVVATTFKNQLDERKDLIREVEPHVKITLNEIIDGLLSGKAFKLTGRLSRVRKEVEQTIIECGGALGWKPSLKNYLVTNTPNSGSSKNKDADKKGIPKITEEQLYEMIGGASG